MRSPASRDYYFGVIVVAAVVLMPRGLADMLGGVSAALAGVTSPKILRRPPALTTILEISHVTLIAVDDVSFVLERGEILGVIGPNGAG